jgi:hypothetical protein
MFVSVRDESMCALLFFRCKISILIKKGQFIINSGLPTQKVDSLYQSYQPGGFEMFIC